MPRQISFGELLHNARERKGLSIDEASQRLRIRPDILRAIEDNDFSHMPPRGYTKNMVYAYARLVGLNPTEITQRYLDEDYAYETGRSRSGSSGSGRTGNDRRRSTSSSMRSTSERGQSSRSDRGYSSSRSSSRGDSARGAQYRRMVSSPGVRTQSRSIMSYLPFIIAGVIILILLIVVIALLFGQGSSTEEELPDVAIVGLTDTSGDTDTEADENATTQAAAETAPTEATFTYSVADGETAYIEITTDGTSGTTPNDTASEITGPVTKTYDVTEELIFVTTNPDAVTLTLDGEEVEPVENTEGSGVYRYTVSFPDILEQWEEEHGATDAEAEADAENAAEEGEEETAEE